MGRKRGELKIEICAVPSFTFPKLIFEISRGLIFFDARCNFNGEIMDVKSYEFSGKED